MRRLAAVAFLALLLGAPAASAWTQHRGGPGRNDTPLLPGGPLDVVANFTLGDGARVSTFWGAGATLTPHGLVFLASSQGTCTLHVRSLSGESVASHDLGPCATAELGAYDPLTDSVIVCRSGEATTEIIQSRAVLTGTTRWGIVPIRDLAPPLAPAFWVCAQPALDEATREVVLTATAFTNGRALAQRVASVDADTGRVRWFTTMPTEHVPMARLSDAALPSAAMWAPFGITLTTTGVVVTGYTTCGQCEDGFVAWWTRDGSFRGIERGWIGKAPSEGENPALRSRAVSQYAVASGAFAAVAVGSEILIINPEQSSAPARAPLRALESTSVNVFWPTGVWTSRRLVVGLPSSLTALDASSLTPIWSWGDGIQWRLRDVVATQGGALHALVATDEAAMLVEVDGEEGLVRRRTPLPITVEITVPREGAWYGRLVALPGAGFVVVDDVGRAAVMGRADPALVPEASVSTRFPMPGEPVAIRVPVDVANVVSYRVDWGDASASTATPGETVRHAFGTRGPREVHVTARYADGRTGTSVVLVDVGGTPPPELSTLQRAFAPENQDMTFGLLGIALTAIGAAVTIGRTRARTARLERELGAIEEMRILSMEAPREGARALRDYRERLPLDLARGRVQGAQFAILDARTARLLRALRVRLLAPYEARFSPEFARLVEAAFADGVLHPAEHAALCAALAAETGLPPDERETVRATLGDFAAHA